MTKFRSYKTVFALFLIASVISLAVGLMLYRSGERDALHLIEGICDTVRGSVFLEALFLLWVFASGPTIYAPTSSFFAVCLYGVLMGLRVGDAMGDGIYYAGVSLVATSITAYLFIIYSSFITLTGLRIFTDKKTDNKRELFDGVLFRAEGFKGIFNFRYILSYIMFFALFMLLMGSVTALKAFLMTL